MRRKRILRQKILKAIVWLAGLGSLAFFGFGIGYILWQGVGSLNFSYLLGEPSILFGTEGLLPALLNTLYVVALCILITVPIGVFASVFLNVYLPTGRIRNMLQSTLDAVLGIPSIVIGFVGLMVFCRFLGLKTSLLSGTLTMCITMLPLVMYSTRHAILAVSPQKLLQATAMGATKWNLITHIILPECMGDIIFSALLVATRVMAEGAALLFTAGAGMVVADSIAGAYSQSGATLAVFLYVNVQYHGNLQAAFAAAAVLIILAFASNMLIVWARRHWRPHNR